MSAKPRAWPFRPVHYSGQRFDECQLRAYEHCQEHRHVHVGYCRESFEAVEMQQRLEAEASYV